MTNARARRDAQKRIREKARERAMLAVRGRYEPSRRDLERLRTGDLLEYLGAQDEATNGRYRPPSYLERRLREPVIARYLAAREETRRRDDG